MAHHVQRSIVVLAHNLRSVFNVGSLLRTSDVFAVERVYVTGFTPYPSQSDDSRDPALQARLTKRIAKSAAGAERTMPVTHQPDVYALLESLRTDGYTVAGLEIDDGAVTIAEYHPPDRIALLLGDEVRGIDASLREHCDVLLQVPMYGQKSSLNVSVAAGVALYCLRTHGDDGAGHR
ncbi:TrmH family RNA methyltransferase [Phytoactinopolyspora halophila]|uniref:TrmH family RNA methyltransferase n=1 Tax=Phytoactinopolyspora halophila TaxID=1981511 RepID=UPI001B8B128B|nr:TrmH family RNA methyltransferase [Phytoactinopolyspora halophila]